MKAEADAEDLTRARRVLASIPPPLSGQVCTFVKIHEAPAPPISPGGEIQLIEGTVFDIYSVMTGGMGGDDDFRAFKIIGKGDQMTSWRKGSIDLALGNVVQIKFVLIKSVISRGSDDDHIDDPILEVWIAANDQVEAVKWYRKAAEQNYAEAQFNLGLCYDNGKGVAKDQVEAVKWYRKAAEQTYAAAQSNLGFCYDNGEGVAKDQVEAVKWYRKAAEQKYAQAQFNLGIHCANGEGVAKDQVEAVKWYRKAAEQNYATAQCNLGFCYEHGAGVAKDQMEAVRWYRKAAEQNYATAQFNLSVWYNNGEGVAKDYVEAYKWRMLAARQGDEDAKKTMTNLEKKMTPEQIAEGQKLAGDFKLLDPEMQNWLAEQAAIARRERAEHYTRLKAKADAEDLKRARRILASIPPPLPGEVRTFVRIYEAPPSSSTPDGEIQLIEGTIFDIYSVMTGGMGGDDDFLAFKIISDGDRMTSWRKGSIDLALGNVVRIKFVLIKSVISRGNDDDHIDDPILEVWVAK